TITGSVKAPTFNPPSGTIYTGPQDITITTLPSDAIIYYTVDGITTPTCSGGANIYTYSVPIPLPISLGTHTYQAIACKTGWMPSAVASATYTYHCSEVGLSSLTVSNGGQLVPVFDYGTTLYALNMPISGNEVSITPTAEPKCAAESIITISDQITNTTPTVITSGSTSTPISMPFNGGNVISLVVTSTWDGAVNKTYTLNGKRGITVQEAYIKKDTTPVDLDQFGKAMAMYGNTLAVGAENINGNKGAVYIFTRDSGGNWSQTQVFSGATSGDLFGSSVAVYNNLLVVGARGKNNNTGAVYVFMSNGGNWSLTALAVLTASNGTIGDNFGRSVATNGSRIVVGADGQDLGAGEVYIFYGSPGTSWSQEAALKASNADRGDAFGFSVSISTDTIAVGAYKEACSAQGIFIMSDSNMINNNNAPQSGAVYLFVVNGHSWTQQVYIKSENSKADNWFGYAIKLAGNYLAVGAPKEDSGATGIGGNDNQLINPKTDSGAVYVFQKDLTNLLWSQESYIKASNSDSNYLFGSSIDGGVGNTNVLVVGAPGENSDFVGINDSAKNNNAPSSGAAYVFVKEQGGAPRFQLAYLKASNTDPSDIFGSAVACNGDVVAVGAPHEQSDATGINCVGQDPFCQKDNSITEGAGAVYTFY
ncbi:MAG: chitobiase/beta-hexosaminidase C-terminal domain-containing protein, partial [Proteobacteria bacterium]|nr:chitobiase/beta-hexosaminidase C-terminal domain-containing protein [Pseudomonadota bacterium]